MTDHLDRFLSEARSPRRPDVWPMGGRVVVVDPPAGQERSGIALPQGVDVDRLYRGIVLRLPEAEETELVYAGLDRLGVLREGDVVYFTGYYRVQDVKVVAAADIVAYERTAPRGGSTE